jgi:hypothetical protein
MVRASIPPVLAQLIARPEVTIMNIILIYRPFVCRLLLLAFTAAAMHSALGSKLVDETFDVLKTRTGSYTNVTVTTRAENYIYIFHTTGMTSIKVADLPLDVRQQLGYATTDATTLQKTNRNNIAGVAARGLTQVNQNLKPFEDNLRKQWELNRSALRFSPEVLYALLAISLLFYLFICYCFHLICVKAKSPHSFLVWVPVLQLIPLLRAAGMSGWWILAFFVPVLNIVAQVLWCLNIVKARGKNIVWAILLIVPVTYPLAFLYLAFSSGGPPAVPTAKPSSKFQTRTLQPAERSV